MAIGESQSSVRKDLPPALERALGAALGLLNRLPIAVYCCDAEGSVIQYNPRAAELWGQAPDLDRSAPRFCGAFAAFRPNGEALAGAESPVADVLRTGDAERDREVIIERPDGSRITIMANVEPLLDEAGALIGAVNCFQDVTRLRAAETQIREGGHIVTALIDALPAAIYTTTQDGKITFFNKSAEQFWGQRPTDERWCGSKLLYDAEGAPLDHDKCPMAVAIKTGEAIRGAEAMAERPNGERIPFLAYPTPIFDSNGVLVGGVNMLVDITERKAAEDRQKVLMDELNHRVKNTLATVQSMAAQCMRGADAPEEAARAFISRLMALSRTHDLLSQESWSGADIATIFAYLAEPYREEQRFLFEGPSLRLRPRAALTLALALNELATNAAKYGALSREGGRVHAAWAREADSLALSWSETGGPPVTPPLQQGFGTRLIERSIAHELSGDLKFNFAPEGLQCRMRIALEPPA